MIKATAIAIATKLISVFLFITASTTAIAYESSDIINLELTQEKVVIHTYVNNNGKVQRLIFAFTASDKVIEFIEYQPIDMAWAEYMALSKAEKTGALNTIPASEPVTVSEQVQIVLPTGVTKRQLYGTLTRFENLLENDGNTEAAFRNLMSLVNDKPAQLQSVSALRELVKSAKVIYGD